MVRNIGHDTSGTHCGKSHIWDVDIDNNFYPMVFPLKVFVNESINRNFKKVFKISLFKRVLEKIKRQIKKF